MAVTQENVAVNGSTRRTPQEIADILRERIRVGELKAGDRLPTQAELADEFGVERGTVRQALRALQEDGLLTNISRGSPPRIAEPAPAGEQPQPTLVGLAPRLTEAFAARRVTIDAVCLTAESLMIGLGEPMRRLHEGTLRPESVEVRILLPSRDISLAFPAPVQGDDDAVHRRWLQMRNAHGQVLRHNLLALRTSHGIDVRVAFRALPFTPPVKLYLLNGTDALFAFYMVGRRSEEVEPRGAGPRGTAELYDVLGTESLLFPFARDAGRDARFVEESQMWFDALWETITTDLNLG
ncbi:MULTISPECIES: GntR family transcriptional regulator [unclassified Streptomyces]|uniref:GntR family transcriptional regulator n=1 Tax=unclassified Streptomyces TaxID=2593676 RepID=UPI001F04B042|nr:MULTISPECIES: GntR family transcriptional regulator [unclassified Streptomyces]MCH0566084.1 GntR family transcriptional regulator [Streptomyces sp. MUM 2J]MCH0567921.1 GntR family transcriptional regulator [Streptomyces sp. MUM 136J]